MTVTAHSDSAPLPVSVELLVTISYQELADQFGDLVANMGQLLADQVLANEEQEKLGYFPALSYYQENETARIATLDSALHIYFMVRETTGGTVRANLRTLLRNIEIDQIQTVAESLPRVRPGDVDARHLLAHHYTPSSIRLHLKAEPRETVDGYPSPESIAGQVQYLLGQRFAQIEIVDIHTE